jgi:hypothetical protein
MTAAAALGFRAVRGGSHVVGVAVEGGEPRIALSTFLATAAEGDRLAYEPYHLAYGMVRGQGESMEAAAAVVAEARRKQEATAAEGLARMLEQLQAVGRKPATAALLINRAGWMTDLLGHALSAPEHPPVMEGLAVREALRFAFRQSGLAVVEMDEKTLDEAASIKLGRSPAELGAALAALGASAGKPWRKEQKAACLAAWVAAAAA